MKIRERKEKESADTLSLEVAHDCAQPRQKGASNLAVDQEGKRLRPPDKVSSGTAQFWPWK